TPSMTVARCVRRSIAPTGQPRSHARSPRAPPDSDARPRAGEEPEESHPIAAKTAGSEAASHPASAPSRGSNHNDPTSPTTDSAAQHEPQPDPPPPPPPHRTSSTTWRDALTG